MIGIIYKNLDKPDEALRYYLRSVDIRKYTDERGLASTYQNIGNVYKHKKNEDSAMYYYAHALALHKKYGNVSSEAMVTSSMGYLKFEFRKFKEAKEYYLLCLNIDKDVVDSNTLATTYINIGNAYSALRDFKTGEEYINKGLGILNKLGDKEGVMSAYEMLAYLFQEAGNDKQALSYRIAYQEMKDSIMSNKEKQQIAELQTKYEVEKKDLELAKNKAEIEAKEKENFLKNSIIVSIIILVVLLAIIASAFFVSSEIKPNNRINIRPGLRFIKNSVYDAQPAIPSINTKFVLSKTLDLRAAYAYGFRSPALRELYFNFIDANHVIVGNPNLKAEHSNSFNGSLTWTPAVQKNMLFSSTLGGFYNQFNDLIGYAQWPTSADTTTTFNVSKFKTIGLTLRK